MLIVLKRTRALYDLVRALYKLRGLILLLLLLFYYCFIRELKVIRTWEDCIREGKWKGRGLIREDYRFIKEERRFK
jgi:hypothetical protein